MKLGLKGQFPPFFPNQGKKVGTDADGAHVMLIEDDERLVPRSLDRKEDGGLMEGLDDLRSHVDQLNEGFELNQGELATIRQDIFEINDTIKNLLSAIESMALKPPGAEAPDKEAPIHESDDDMVPATASPISSGAAVTTIQPEPEAISDVDTLQKPSMKVSVTRPRSKDAPDEPQASYGNGYNDPTHHHSIFQAQKVLEFEVDKLFVMRLKGTPVESSDLERFDRCVDEFRRQLR